MKGIGVLISGGGSNLQAIIDAVNEGKINAVVKVVISDRRNAYGLVRARQSGIPAVYMNKKEYPDYESFNRAVLDVLKEHGVDIVVLAGYLSILSREVVEAYRHRIINIHPSLIPSFCGMGFYGERVHQAVLDYGARVTGATVHFVDENADTGPILLQKSVPVMEDDDAHTLSQRVLKVEHELLPLAVALLADDRVTVDGRKVTIKKL